MAGQRWGGRWKKQERQRQENEREGEGVTERKREIIEKQTDEDGVTKCIKKA